MHCIFLNNKVDRYFTKNYYYIGIVLKKVNNYNHSKIITQKRITHTYYYVITFNIMRKYVYKYNIFTF